MRTGLVECLHKPNVLQDDPRKIIAELHNARHLKVSFLRVLLKLPFAVCRYFIPHQIESFCDEQWPWISREIKNTSNTFQVILKDIIRTILCTEVHCSDMDFIKFK